jgi:hypothetical protein
MAILGNTYTTYDANRLREQFSNAIYMISPEETPFLSLVERESIDGRHPEWQTDTLATPVITNQQIEGDEYAYSQILPTVRIGNYTEIARKSYLISGSEEKNTKADPASELGRERRKKGTELKTDMEVALLANKPSVVGTTAIARKSAGFAAWITTNDQRAAGGADGGFSGGVVGAGTNGSAQRAFTKALLDAAILAAYTSGGSPTTLMVSPYVKTVFSGFMNAAGLNTSQIFSRVQGEEQATIYAAADAYRSDFGVIDIMPNRQLARAGATAARNAYLIDLDKVGMGTFRDVFEDRPAKSGDAEKRVLLCEYSLIMKNEAAHAVIYDLFGMSSIAYASSQLWGAFSVRPGGALFFPR